MVGRSHLPGLTTLHTIYQIQKRRPRASFFSDIQQRHVEQNRQGAFQGARGAERPITQHT